MADERNRMLEQLNTDDWQECRQSVLIVDDSAMNRRMLTEILGGRFDTAEATSGEECLHLLEENRDGISIVLLTSTWKEWMALRCWRRWTDRKCWRISRSS